VKGARAHRGKVARRATIDVQRPGELAPLGLVVADLEQAEWPPQLPEVLRCRGDDDSTTSQDAADLGGIAWSEDVQNHRGDVIEQR
jgi:hypothetical protein